MAWPFSRLTTYIAGITKVKGADLNAIQDQVIDLSDGEWATLQTFEQGAVAAAGEDFRTSGGGLFKHGEVFDKISALGGRATTPTGDWTLGPNYGIQHSADNTGSWLIPIKLLSGERLKGVYAHCLGAAVKTITMKVYRVTTAGLTQLGSDAVTSGATWQQLYSGAISETAGAGEYFFVLFAATAHASQVAEVLGIEVARDWA